jgi:hypothetical protein
MNDSTRAMSIIYSGTKPLWTLIACVVTPADHFATDVPARVSTNRMLASSPPHTGIR